MNAPDPQSERCGGSGWRGGLEPRRCSGCPDCSGERVNVTSTTQVPEERSEADQGQGGERVNVSLREQLRKIQRAYKHASMEWAALQTAIDTVAALDSEAPAGGSE